MLSHDTLSKMPNRVAPCRVGVDANLVLRALGDEIGRVYVKRISAEYHLRYHKAYHVFLAYHFRNKFDHLCTKMVKVGDVPCFLSVDTLTWRKCDLLDVMCMSVLESSSTKWIPTTYMLDVVKKRASRPPPHIHIHPKFGTHDDISVVIYICTLFG